MHRIPKIFSKSKQEEEEMDSKSHPSTPTRPRLDRTHAAKNIDYSPTTPTSSFRISGKEGELDILCKSLGFSGPDDFAIPYLDYQAMFSNHDHSTSTQLEVSDVDDERSFPASVNASGEVVDVIEGVGRSVVLGIRGERPPAVLLSNVIALEDQGDHAIASATALLSPEEDDIRQGVTRLGLGSGVLSDSSSFTSNSNDDDSSSTTTDPMSISPNGTLRRQISSWDRGRHLGTGSYGSVFEGIADGGFFFAVKEVSLLDQGEKGRDIINQFEQEMTFLSQFEHKNIVRYLGTDKDDSKLYIFLELVPQGSLLSLYQRFRFQDSHVSVYTRQILEGLKYLHERNVVHRDIKCANILLDVDGYVKLADFGLAKVAKLNDAKSCKGTPYWMAPEVVKPNQWYGRAADIWSLGCTVLEMLTRNFPYHPLDGFQAMFKIGSGEPPPVPEFLSKDARDFILKCLQVDPDTRPSAADLLDHLFVKRPHSSSASASNHHHGMRD